MLADLISGFLYFKFGPRITFASVLTITVIGSTVLIIALEKEVVAAVPIFIGMAKFGVAASFNCAFIASVLLIPTILASTVFGLNNFMARTVTVLAPQIADIEGMTPLVVNIFCAAIAAFGSLFLITKQPKYI